MNQKKIERRALLVSVIVNTVIAGAGFWVYTVTNIQALFLDFFFSFVALLSSAMAILISKVSKHSTKSYPEGMYFLEPLYALLKSMLTIALLLISVSNTAESAFIYFKLGDGEPLYLYPVLPYTLLMVILCFGLAFFNTFQNKKIGNISTMLSAESRTNFIDGLQSLGVGICIGILYFIKINSPLGFLHYTGDFFITLLLSIISIKAPIVLIIQSFKELSGSLTQNPDIIQKINAIVHKHFTRLDQISKVNIYKQGMNLKILVFISEASLQSGSEIIDDTKQRITNDLMHYYENIDVVIALAP